MLDLVSTGDLARDQLGVVDDLDLAPTLLVATPIRSPSSSSTAPSESETTTPIAAGPGLPRAPPSTWTTTFNSSP
jgi:hypothetical protein